jgi:hypothetical protein
MIKKIIPMLLIGLYTIAGILTITSTPDLKINLYADTLDAKAPFKDWLIHSDTIESGDSIVAVKNLKGNWQYCGIYIAVLDTNGPAYENTDSAVCEIKTPNGTRWQRVALINVTTGVTQEYITPDSAGVCEYAPICSGMWEIRTRGINQKYLTNRKLLISYQFINY